MTNRYFTQKELARYWGISHRTLERWRWSGTGPKFLKLGRRVKYRACDVDHYESGQLRRRSGNNDNEGHEAAGS